MLPQTPSKSHSTQAQPGKSRASDLSRVAWLHSEDMDHSEWVAAGRRLGAIGRGSQWWIGDWIRFGAAKWGEKYTEAARITGYDHQSLRNLAWIAARFDLSRRRDKLTWSHHAEVAGLELEEQEAWLERAIAEKLSAADLRVEVRSVRRGQMVSEANGGEREVDSDGAVPLICPQCGARVPLPERNQRGTAPTGLAA